jgi:PAS domain S-box-containing protein
METTPRTEGAVLSLESVLRTDELARRPSRPPDYRAESEALGELTQALADSPQTVLQRLAEIAMRSCRAGSGGISLLSKPGVEQAFHWPAIAGAWSPQIGSGMPWNSPSGIAIERQAPQLFVHPERHFPFQAPIDPPITEALFAPFFVQGKPVGTLWVICHDESRQFDAEDVRLLTSLGRIASAEYQAVDSADAFRRAAVKALVAAEPNAKFRNAFDQGSYFAGVMTVDGTVVEANRLSLELTGFRRDQVVGRKFWDLGWWSRAPELAQMVLEGTRTAASGQQFRRETRYFTADGSERMMDLILAPVRDEAGRVVFIAPTGTDITERKRNEVAMQQSEQMLKEADRRKDEFLTMLAHELRDPLAPIRNAVEILKRTATRGEAAQPMLDMMQRQVGQLVRLIDDLLDVSRIGRRRIAFNKARIDLNQVIDRALDAARPLASEMGHELTVELPPHPIWVNADADRLIQVVENLLDNACKFTGHGGRIGLKVEAPADGVAGTGAVVIRVRDSGIGIAAEQLPRVFEMFTQVDAPLERSPGGLGIGLTLVKNVVELHDGTVEAHSRGLGHGSEFVVRLPIPVEAGEQPAEQPAPPARDVHAPSQRILIVDDNRDSAESLMSLLQLIGHDAGVAHDGVQGLDAARSFRPDVVLLDLGLPKLNGFDVARRIREEPWGKNMALVALTGWGGPEEQEKTKRAGFDAHLVKPVHHDALTRCLAGLGDAR